jgi:hypothetical protein
MIHPSDSTENKKHFNRKIIFANDGGRRLWLLLPSEYGLKKIQRCQRVPHSIGDVPASRLGLIPLRPFGPAFPSTTTAAAVFVHPWLHTHYLRSQPPSPPSPPPPTTTVN